MSSVLAEQLLDFATIKYDLKRNLHQLQEAEQTQEVTQAIAKLRPIVSAFEDFCSDRCGDTMIVPVVAR